MKEFLNAPKSYIALVMLFFVVGVTELITLNKDQRLDVVSTCMLVVAISLYLKVPWAFLGLKILSVFYAVVNVPFLILGLLGGTEKSGQVTFFGSNLDINYWLYFSVMSGFIALQLFVAFWVSKRVNKTNGEIETEA